VILSDVSIKRPVFATMIIAAIVVFGVVLYTRLNVAMFPEVNFPVVTVSVIYPGASPETMEMQVTDLIEEAVNSLSGIRSLRSVSLESVSQVFVEFDLDIEAATAAQEIRDRISTVQQKLPDGAELPNVQKLDLGAAPVMQLALSGGRDQAFLLRYAEDKLKPQLERIRGVGQVDVIGGRDREMHVWVSPESLRSYGLTVHEVVGALQSQSLDLPGGRVERGGRELVVRTNAQARSAEEMSNLAIATRQGAVIKLRDVARVEDGFEEARSKASVDGKPAVALILRKQSDGNTVLVADLVKQELPRLRAAAGADVRLEVLVDNSREIRGSIETVQLDLFLGAGLAILIIFLFLRDPRATMISALALPTSVIGTFGFVKVMGFTLNLMTTLALSLSIGILIDDAIVVIENIVRRRTALHESPMEAAQRGTAEIGLAVLATTLSIVAVFVPVAFMQGLLGQFFYEFGLTVAFAVLLSLFVSFTLTPMLSSRFLRDHHGPARGLSRLIERVLDGIDALYRRTIRWAIAHRVVTLGGAVGALVLTLAAAPMMGFEFMPIEDVGQFSVKIELPSGTPLEETATRAEAMATKLRTVPGFASTFVTVGGGVQERVDLAEIVVTLAPKEERSFHQTAAMAHTRSLFANEPNLLLSVEQLQAIGGGGRQAPVQIDLLGGDLEKVARVAQGIAAELRGRKGFVDVDTSYRAGKPELRVDVDRARAADLGITSAQIATTVRALVAGEVASQVEHEGQRYDVRVQLPIESRQVAAAGAVPQLRGAAGQLVDLTTVAQLVEDSGPSQIERLSRQRKVTLYANLDGKVLGDAMNELNELVKQKITPDVQLEVGGDAKFLQESMESMLLALFLAVICVYMILAAQFESFAHPLTIMSSLPFSLIGAFGLLIALGMSMSIFGMIGLIMLMGLVTKNGILLVDFANQRRAAGDSVELALETAGATRLRPILMTTAAMIFGMLPVALGHGEGGEGRAPMGATVIGGLITSTALTVVVVPVIYLLVDRAIVRMTRLFRREAPRGQLASAHELPIPPASLKDSP